MTMAAAATAGLRRSLGRACRRRGLAVAMSTAAAIAMLRGRRGRCAVAAAAAGVLRGVLLFCFSVVSVGVAAAAATRLLRWRLAGLGARGALVPCALPAATGAGFVLRPGSRHGKFPACE